MGHDDNCKGFKKHVFCYCNIDKQNMIKQNISKCMTVVANF